MKGGGFIKTFCFTVDDNIRFLKEITERAYESIFDHPYLDLYRRLHEAFGLKVQMNLFYRLGNFDLSQVSERYVTEWKENANWLKLSFHSEKENVKPYESADYDTVYADCAKTHREIKRFASPLSLANTTTIHYCLLTSEGVKAMENNGVFGLLGLFGTDAAPCTSYSLGEDDARKVREGAILKQGGISFASIDIILNLFSKEEIVKQLELLKHRESIRVMIHEQYYYSDYMAYQPEFEQGYQSAFFEDLIS